MRIAAVCEHVLGETRSALSPASVARLIKLGAAVSFESGLGLGSGIGDQDLIASGATVSRDRSALLSQADAVLQVRSLPPEDLSRMKKGALQISLLDPVQEKREVEAASKAGLSQFSLQMVPRTTRAQKFDVLSSQASLAGYVAVILAADRLPKIFPMMMTPSGTINPARVFVIGAGVAGLQAIATAKRLGARVDAFDTRPVVEEQVKSLGAKFLRVDLGETGQTKDGYAKELSKEQLEKQRLAMAKQCSLSDVVITTALVFGRPAPRLLTRDMVSGMRAGSVVVDLAVESGGNVEGSERDQEVEIDGVTILGLGNLPARVARDATLMFANNLAALVEDLWDVEQKSLRLQAEDEVVKAALLVRDGKILREFP